MVPIPAHFGPLTQSWRQRAEMGVGGSTLLSLSLPCRSSASRCYLREWCPGMWNPQWKCCKKLLILPNFWETTTKCINPETAESCKPKCVGKYMCYTEKAVSKGENWLEAAGCPLWRSAFSPGGPRLSPWHPAHRPVDAGEWVREYHFWQKGAAVVTALGDLPENFAQGGKIQAFEHCIYFLKLSKSCYKIFIGSA